MGASKPSRPSRKLPPRNNDKPCHDRACPRSWQRIPPSGNVPLFPAKAAGLPAAFFDAVRTGEGERGPFWKKVSLPPSHSPHPPKNFYAGLWQVVMTHRPFHRPWSPGDTLKRMDRMARTPRDGGRPQEGRHPVPPPPPVSPATVPAGCRKTDALFKCGTIIYKIRLLSCLFAKRGTIAGPPDNGGDLTTDPNKSFTGGWGSGGRGTLLEKRPPSPGLASPEARYHAHVRSSPDCGICP